MADIEDYVILLYRSQKQIYCLFRFVLLLDQQFMGARFEAIAHGAIVNGNEYVLGVDRRLAQHGWLDAVLGKAAGKIAGPALFGQELDQEVFRWAIQGGAMLSIHDSQKNADAQGIVAI